MAADGKPVLRQLADGDLGPDEDEPLQLWLLPILLRSRQRYYAEAIAAVEQQIAEAWTAHGHMYPSREKFDNSPFVEGAWRHAQPAWWGLNDIVGFIDVRLSATSASVDSALFLTGERASRSLVRKTFVLRGQERVFVVGGDTNADIQSRIDTAVTKLAASNSVNRRFVDLRNWRSVLYCTDLLCIFRGIASP